MSEYQKKGWWPDMAYPLHIYKPITITPALLTATSVAEADYPEWSAGTTYADGDRVILAAQHRVYESVAGGNTGNNPAMSTQWSEVGPTNLWRMFDLSISTATFVTDADYYEITPGRAIPAVALVNVQGLASVRVRVTDPTFGLVYDQTRSMAALPTEADWWAWFFDERDPPTRIILGDLPSYPAATIRLDFATSVTASIGVAVLCTKRAVGLGVQQGASIDIQDYSRKERNEWGDTVLMQRAYARRATLDVFMANAELDSVYNLLVSLRATPCLWVASDRRDALTLFGFYRDFSINVSYADYSDCSIELEGLT